MARVKDELNDFIRLQAKAEIQRSKWFDFGDMRVYLRAGKMFSYSQNGIVLGLCISNVDVTEDLRRQGIFTQFVHMIVGTGTGYGYNELQIENAITPEMVAYCKKNEMHCKKSDYGSVDSYWLEM